jgi:hypothetical protein
LLPFSIFCSWFVFFGFLLVHIFNHGFPQPNPGINEPVWNLNTWNGIISNLQYLIKLVTNTASAWLMNDS